MLPPPAEMAVVPHRHPSPLPELSSLPGGGEDPELACHSRMSSYLHPGWVCVGLGADLEYPGLAPGRPFLPHTLGPGLPKGRNNFTLQGRSRVEHQQGRGAGASHGHK